MKCSNFNKNQTKNAINMITYLPNTNLCKNNKKRFHLRTKFYKKKSKISIFKKINMFFKLMKKELNYNNFTKKLKAKLNNLNKKYYLSPNKTKNINLKQKITKNNFRILHTPTQIPNNCFQPINSKNSKSSNNPKNQNIFKLTSKNYKTASITFKIRTVRCTRK